ncbi:MAG: ABC transporter permease subunit [Oscillospiraceae bacterium]
MLLCAALQCVPKGQYEAASIDGASAWKQFLCVTIPNISKNIIMVVLLRVIDTFRLFDKKSHFLSGYANRAHLLCLLTASRTYPTSPQ